ncbi:Uu.00g070360.m01.CDS01 [Anthostomella pinea]|uniref:Uu.00g070360.m01.CDS01 n=1 Tax=Anthostomella pinea TaxID=933095 RepID=A0AAI8VP29_9PEZI|nr:Uu.00g070360.m01.CDS01 [Anthostomella pinea]
MPSHIHEIAEKREQQLDQSSEESPAQAWDKNSKEKEGGHPTEGATAVHKLADKREDQLNQAGKGDGNAAPATEWKEGQDAKISAPASQVGHEAGSTGGIAPAPAHPTRPTEA